MKKINLQFGFLVLLIVLLALSRMLPHPLNFSPLVAMGLFGAAHFAKRWQAFLIPIVAAWASDLFINNVLYSQYYPTFVWFYEGFYWQYGTYLLIILLGTWYFKNNISIPKVLGGVFGSGLIFYLFSNFGVWLTTTLYPLNFSGLIICYTAGLPFYKSTLAGDLFYSTLLFGSYYLIQRFFPFFRLKHIHYV